MPSVSPFYLLLGLLLNLFMHWNSGLIHANHGLRVMDYLSQEIRAGDSEVGRWVGWEGGPLMGRVVH